MVIFGVILSNEESGRAFMDKSNARLLKADIVRNPFVGKIIRIKNGVFTDTYIIDMEPIYPRYYFVAPLLIIGPALFIQRWLSFWYLPGLFVLSSAFLWNTYFYYAFLTLGLRKSGYIGKIKLIRNGGLLKLLIEQLI